MNQKTARMLRDMHSGEKRSKNLWNALTHIEKGRVRANYKATTKILPPSLTTVLERI